MKTMYREQLDEMLRAQFGNRPDFYLVLAAPESHAKHGLLVCYQDGCLHVYCGKCNERVAIVAVANEPKSTSFSA